MLTSFIIFSLACVSLHVPSVQQQWRHLVETHGDSRLVTVFIPWAIGVIVYWAFGLSMLAVEVWQYPRHIFSRKIQPSIVLQTQGSQLQPPLLNCCRIVLLNQFVFMLPTLIAIVRLSLHTFDIDLMKFTGFCVPELRWDSNRRSTAVAAANGRVNPSRFHPLYFRNTTRR